MDRAGRSAVTHWRNSSNVLPFRAPFKRGEVAQTLTDGFFVIIGFCVLLSIPAAFLFLWWGLF